MKRYVTNTNDTCWKDCIACILEIDPKKVPDFVKLYDDDYVNKTREWLRKKFQKTITFMPMNVFMETSSCRFNPPFGPEGYSIGFVEMASYEDSHAIICYNGGILYDNGTDRHEEYKYLKGFFLIHDLESKMKKKRVKSKA